MRLPCRSRRRCLRSRIQRPDPAVQPCWSRTTTIRNRLATIMMTERAICAVVAGNFLHCFSFFLIAHNETMRAICVHDTISILNVLFQRGFPYFHPGICLRQAAGECFQRIAHAVGVHLVRIKIHDHQTDGRPAVPPLWYLRSSDSFFSFLSIGFVQSRRRQRMTENSEKSWFRPALPARR